MSQKKLAKTPKEGRVVIALNHATALDRRGLMKEIYSVRQDIKIIANELLLTLENLMTP